jgi:hypothetical protein
MVRKHGTHQGWYENGKLKFISHFKTGNYTGDQFTYHDNGQVFEYKKYNGDGKLLVSKIFARRGKFIRARPLPPKVRRMVCRAANSATRLRKKRLNSNRINL